MNQATWSTYSIHLQLATVGAEVGRAISWRANPSYGNPDDCFSRALSYLQLTISDAKVTDAKRRELCRVKEVLLDWYYGDNLYHSTNDGWERYFLPFSLAANRK